MPIRQIQQIDEEHCGPAVLQMLLESVGVIAGQHVITEMAGVEDIIAEHGVRVDQLALACNQIAPQVQFWYKYKANVQDLKVVLDKGYGVGVEWKGLFYESEEEEEADGDYGHYAIVEHIDFEYAEIILVDPYKDFYGKRRLLPLDMFIRRWWDTNELTDPVTNRKYEIKDEQVMFMVTPLNEEFPPENKFKRFSATDFETWYRE